MSVHIFVFEIFLHEIGINLFVYAKMFKRLNY